jgi:hypothetical protein
LVDNDYIKMFLRFQIRTLIMVMARILSLPVPLKSQPTTSAPEVDAEVPELEQRQRKQRQRKQARNTSCG